MLGACNHDIIVVDALFEWNASLVYDGVIFTILNHCWNLYVLNKCFGGIVPLIRLEVRFIINFPIDFAFKLINTL